MAKIETDQVPSPPKPTGKPVAPDGKPKNRFILVVVNPTIIKGEKYDVDDVVVLEAEDRELAEALLAAGTIQEYSMVV